MYLCDAFIFVFSKTNLFTLVQCEGLQDKISQIRDARAALEALREEHRDRLRREKEEQERIR